MWVLVSCPPLLVCSAKLCTALYHIDVAAKAKARVFGHFGKLVLYIFHVEMIRSYTPAHKSVGYG
jgi:hypothetical protein